ncbi:MAG: hypothetical protein AB1416_04525 [Actinomycetota bacterium]
MTATRVALAAAGAAAAALAGGAAAAGTPPVRPADFVAGIDNPWMPLRPGTVHVYTGTKDGGAVHETVRVLRRTIVVMGVRCVVVDDTLRVDGRIAERTEDWYAQDRAGRVWYFGERTRELDRRGRVVSTEGSWRAGVDGALPGIVMPAAPRPGQVFRQEYYRGHAEDHFRVVSVTGAVRVPAGAFRPAVVTVEWTPLEPGVRDRKYYARGVGLVREESIRGGAEYLSLAAVRRDPPG